MLTSTAVPQEVNIELEVIPELQLSDEAGPISAAVTADFQGQTVINMPEANQHGLLRGQPQTTEVQVERGRSDNETGRSHANGELSYASALHDEGAPLQPRIGDSGDPDTHTKRSKTKNAQLAGKISHFMPKFQEDQETGAQAAFERDELANELPSVRAGASGNRAGPSGKSRTSESSIRCDMDSAVA